MTPKIIGISGKTGAGKTTLGRALAEDLQATFISWDDFDDISQGPVDYAAWYAQGQDYTAWNYKALANVLQTLKSGSAVPHPVLNVPLAPTELIIFDAPLGRLHPQTGQWIDVCTHLDVPLDVLLARRLLRDFNTQDTTKEDLLKELTFYLSDIRPLFFDEDLKKSADLIVDGLRSTEKQTEDVKRYIGKDA